MAAAGLQPLKRSSSYELLPPYMSELVVVLLGGSFDQRCSVQNLILGVFYNREYNGFETKSGKVGEKMLKVINTPDLPFCIEDNLIEFTKECMTLCSPGPHVFLLLLDPGNDFTEAERKRHFAVLKHFSEQSFDHSLILILKPRDERLRENYVKNVRVKDLIIKCRYRYLKMGDIERLELLTRIGQIVKENCGEHLIYEENTTVLPSDHQSQKQKNPFTSFFTSIKDKSSKVAQYIQGFGKNPSFDFSALRIVLLGKSDDEMTKLGNFVIQYEGFSNEQPQSHAVACCGEWNGKTLPVVKTADMFGLSEEKMKREVKRCVQLCSPGPNMLLLLVKPSDFTAEDRKTLRFILSFFGQDAFKHSMVIITQKEMSSTVSKVLKDCGEKYYMFEEDHGLLMKKMENTVQRNQTNFLTFTEETTGSNQTTKQTGSEDTGPPMAEGHIRPRLNLVLCGRTGAGKTSAAKAILNQMELNSVSNTSKCVKNQGEVCERWVSLVELPALYGKPQQEGMEESLRCISLCDPEGIHAFILVLPVGSLTDEDKGELQTIQDTFSSQVNNFIITLLTVESDPSHPDIVNSLNENKDIQKFYQSCGGRYVVFSINGQQQIPQLLELVETNISDRENRCCYTTKTLACGQMEDKSQLQVELKELITKKTVTETTEQLSQCLRIVLIGKTGSGKSTSGNTILRKKVFKETSGQISATSSCQKQKGEVDGRSVVVVDTPGLFDNRLSRNQTNEELVKCMSLLAPGPHVFLLVMPIGRLTEEDQETLNLIKKVFGEDSEKFTIILFTKGDTLEHEKKSIEYYIENDCHVSCKKLIANCGGRYHVFNNYNKQNKTQVSELIEKIDAMVKMNGSSFYTNDMLQEAEEAIQKKMERILKEREEETKEKMKKLEEKHKEEIKVMQTRIEQQTTEIEKERKLKAEELKRMEESINEERERRHKEQDARAEEETKKKMEEDEQQEKWKQERETLEKKIKSESDEKEIIDKNLEQVRKEMEEKQTAFEKERNEWWKKRQQEDEERQNESTKFKQLQEKFEQETEKYENQIKEDQKRKEQDEKARKDLEESYERKVEEMKRLHEEEARRRAEEFNEFKDKYNKHLEALIEKHKKEIQNIKDQYCHCYVCAMLTYVKGGKQTEEKK